MVDDHPLARRGVASLLAEAFPALELREAGTTAEAITIATSFQPNLVVLDLRTPDPPGPAATCAVLKERNKRGHIVILTAFAEMDLIRQCLAAGADGVLLKDAEPDDLIMRLRHLAAGTRVIDPRVAQSLAGRHGQRAARRDRAGGAVAAGTGGARPAGRGLLQQADRRPVVHRRDHRQGLCRSAAGQAGGRLPAAGRRPGGAARAVAIG